MPGDRLQAAAARVASVAGLPMHHDAYRFVETIREKFWLGMLSAIDAALVAAARRPAGDDRSGPRPGSDAEFMRFLIASREYLLSEGRIRPAPMHDDEFRMLKPLCEHLIRQGRFAPARLELFAGLDRWPIAAPNAGAGNDRRA